MHFHGVPFVHGQLTNEERREVGTTFVAINREHLADTSTYRNKLLKSIFTRTAAKSNHVDNYKLLTDASEEALKKLSEKDQLLREMLAHCNKSIPSIFVELIQRYVNTYTVNDRLMRTFWGDIQEHTDIPSDVIQYGFPLTSTSKTPDHAFKFGFGFNVETRREEQAVAPCYYYGLPKHRLAGFLYLVTTYLEDYAGMLKEGQVVDVVQLSKSGRIGLNAHFLNQLEVIFLGGVDCSNVSLVIPLVYPKFVEKNRKLYEECFGISDEDWVTGCQLRGESI